MLEIIVAIVAAGSSIWLLAWLLRGGGRDPEAAADGGVSTWALLGEASSDHGDGGGCDGGGDGGGGGGCE